MTDDNEKEIERRVQEELAKAKDKPKVSKKRKRKEIKHPLNKAQVQAFFDTFEGRTATSKRNKLLFKVLLEMGMRYGEAISMKTTDIFVDDDSDPYYYLPAERSKNGEAAYINLSKELYKELKDLKKIYKGKTNAYIFRPISKDVPIQKSYVRRIVNLHGRLAELPFKISSHVFRRTFAVRMLKSSGGDLYLTSKMLRHRSLASTQSYLSVYTEDRKKAMLKVLADNKIDY